MDTPAQWSAFPCEDYFRSGWAERGHFDEPSQLWVIVPLAEVYEDATAEFLAIGRSGCDRIDFGYRKNHAGLWAFCPIEREFKFMARSVGELVTEWCAGRLSV